MKLLRNLLVAAELSRLISLTATTSPVALRDSIIIGLCKRLAAAQSGKAKRGVHMYGCPYDSLRTMADLLHKPIGLLTLHLQHSLIISHLIKC